MGESWGLWSQTAGIATPKNNGDPSLGAKTSVLSSLVGTQPVARRGVSGRHCRIGDLPPPIQLSTWTFLSHITGTSSPQLPRTECENHL